MTFTYDTQQALKAAAALVNTEASRSASGGDELTTQEELDRFVSNFGYTGTVTGTRGALDAVRELRPEFLKFWTLDRDAVAALTNAMLRRARAIPQLVRHDSWDWHLHATEPDAPFATIVLGDIAMAMVDVIRTDEIGRLRFCAADTCKAVFVDLSRNRSKRYCDVANCGNRANVAAYRARRRGDNR